MKKALLSAFCKINLSLKLGKRRSDGYHDIDTVMQTVSLHDEIEFRRTEGSSVMKISGLSGGISVSSDNLVMKALEKIKCICNISDCFSISLIKNVPSAAGLGGGSSDAALVLNYFGRMHGLSDIFLSSIASELGSDIPFFCFGGRCRCTGRGELIEMMDDLPKKKLIIVMPKFGISTIEAYRLWDCFIDKNPTYIHEDGNDFEKAIFPSYPILSDIKNRLIDLGAVYASMSGSGSAMYGIFDSDDLLKDVITDSFLNESGKIYMSELIGRKEYLDNFMSIK